MARSTAMTTQTEIDQTTVTVEIHHADFGADATADVRCFGLDELTQDVFDEHYESLGEPVEIDSGVLDAGEPVLAIEILEDVWRRTQGGRTDVDLPYDGSQVRSSCVGDVVVLDGVPFAAADVGFERVEIDVGQDEDEDDEQDDDPRFPRDDVTFEEGDHVRVSTEAWYDRDEIGHGLGGTKGVEVVEDREDDGEVVVAFGDEQRVVDRRAVVATDLEAGDEIVFEYASVYSDSRVEKTGTIEEVFYSRGQLGGSFDGLYVELDDEKTYYLSASGLVKSTDPRRRIGNDAVVERVEDEDDEDEVTSEDLDEQIAAIEAREEIFDDDETISVDEAEIEREAEQQARFERHVDRTGWH